MTYNSSQILESFIPLYDTVPLEWEKARPFLVETLKKISEGVNARTIGFHLEEQLLSGNQFIGLTTTPQQYRDIFRKVIDCSPLVAGANTFAHGITFDANFTLIHLWVSATNSTTFIAETLVGTDVTMDVTNININSPGAFDRAFAFVEYTLEA